MPEETYRILSIRKAKRVARLPTPERVRENAGARPAPGCVRASKLILHLPDLIAEHGPRLLVVPNERVSKWEQKKAGNLANRRARLLHLLTEAGVEIHEEHFEEQVAGRHVDATKRAELVAACKKARSLERANPDRFVAVVTSTRPRFVRHEKDNGRGARFHEVEGRHLDQLAILTKGVQLASYLHPDASLHCVRSYDTKVAGTAGAPKKPKCKSISTEDRERLLPRVQYAAFELDWSHCKIAREILRDRRKESTVRNWLRKYRYPAEPCRVNGVLILPGDWEA